jgi:hypothetical protein
MKYLFAAILLFTVSTVNAQGPGSIALNVYGGYTFPDRVRLDNYYTDIQGAFEWGGGLEYFVRRNKSIELKYLRMDTRFPLYSPLGNQVNKNNDNGALNFILLGGNNYFARTTDQKMVPYAGVDLGVGWADGPTQSSGAKFSWDAKLGVKLMTSSAVSFKLHAYVQSMISAFGTDFWYYPGWGTYAVSDYAHIFQFGLGGAVCFGKNK